MPLEVDHIIPEGAGGAPELANLCLCCRPCNGYKWQRTYARDPQTGRRVRVFHPRLCEPFLGSGTTAVTLAPRGISITGIEYNPFIRFVAATKAAIPLMSSRELEHTIVQLETELLPIEPRPVPELSTLHNTQYSDAQTIQLLLSAYQRIQDLDTTPAIRSALHLGLAATIEAVFHLRKDGRALRYVPKPIVPPVRQALSRHWRTILVDVQAYESSPLPLPRGTPLFAVYGGSATNLQVLSTADGAKLRLAPHTFDTMIYSPPYLNNFDYSEVYKLELWLLHFIKSYDTWKELRLGTIRSHHSLVFPETQHLSTDPRTQAIAMQLCAMGTSVCLPDKVRERVRRVINGYFDDMYLALCEQWRVLKPGGIVSYIVANSRHYYLPVATDVILGEIARCIGFELLDLVVLRKRNGRTRQKLFLRESVVFVRKPTGTTNTLP
jgi:DNA modification methylase